jgi:hypothetical protein
VAGALKKGHTRGCALRRQTGGRPVRGHATVNKLRHGSAPGAQRIEAEIPQAWGISQKSPGEELERKAWFLALRRQKCAHLDGVTPGKTTVKELVKLGTRTTQIDKNTNQPYLCYVIKGRDVWYDETSGLANCYYIRLVR